MKKLYLLLGMIVFGVVGINAEPIYPGGMTGEQYEKIEQVQQGKLARQRELARPAVYKRIDPLVDKEDWSAIFSMLDQMQGVINVNEYRFNGDTLLIRAILNNNFLAAKTLLEKYKANPDLKTASRVEVFGYVGYTPLMYAIMDNDFAIAKLLLQHGANPYLGNSGGDNAFSLAQGNPAMLKLLREYASSAAAA